MNLRWLQVWDLSDVKDAAATGGFWSVDESVKQSSTGNVTCVPKSKGVFDGNLFPDLIAEERHERHQRSKRSPRRPCGACRLYAAAPHSLTTNKSRWFDGLVWEDKEVPWMCPQPEAKWNTSADRWHCGLQCRQGVEKDITCLMEHERKQKWPVSMRKNEIHGKDPVANPLINSGCWQNALSKFQTN